jgi:eukaryotic-like serine/threonine-protein kinase
MTSSRWQATVKIFEAALDVAPSERGTFIHDACDGDPELESEIVRLLEADDGAGSFLERPLLSTLAPRTTAAHECSRISAGSIVSDRFKILRFIGQGGMGQVYEAFDLELRGRVALKVIRPDIASDPRMLSRFRREVQLTRLITHPNVCRTFDIDRHSSHAGANETDITFLTMELLEGETLASLLRRKRFSPTEALPLVLQMIEALSAAHTVGVVHRDFKPSNVILVPSGSNLRVVVTDFGLARAMLNDGELSAEHPETSVTGSRALMGTLIYMAPEQFERGETSVASDIYSLGLVIYEMITGQRPFADPVPFAEATKRLKRPVPSAKSSVPDLQSDWEDAISRCLELEPKDRFADIRQVAEAISSVGHGNSEFSENGTSGKQQRLHPTDLVAIANSGRSARKKIALITVAALAVSLSVGFSRLIKWRSGRSHIRAGSEVLVTEIHNVTGDPEFTGTGELLRSQLSQSTYMNLLEPSRVTEALERMSKPRDTVLEPSVAREVAWREGVPLVIFGTVSRVAEDYKFDLKVEKIGSDPSRAESSWNFSEAAASKKDFFDVVRDGGIWLRKLSGEAETDIGRTDRRPEDVTTSSWEALKAYSDAQRLASVDKDEEATLLFKRAAEKDPDFAMAWMRLGDTLDTLGRSGEGFGYWRKALAVSGDRRLTEREELRIKGMYASDTGDLKSAIDYFSQYSIAYPNDHLGYFYRGVPLMLLGRTEEAIQVLHEAEKRAPNSYYVADHLARYNLILGNFDEVARYTARVRQLGHPWWADEVDGLAAVLKGDYDRAQRLFQSLAQADDPFLRSLRFYLEASALAEQGNDDEAIEILKEGIAADLPSGDSSDRADKLLGLAFLYLKKGDRNSSREAALKAIEAESSARRSANVGQLLARGGFVRDAQRLLSGIDGNDPALVVKVTRHWLGGEILLAQGRCREALEELQKGKAQDQEQGLLRDYWAHALLVCGRRDDARAEFDRMLSRPGQAWHQPEFYPPGAVTALVREAHSSGN